MKPPDPAPSATAQRPTPEEKAKQALEMAQTAIWLKHAGLGARYPGEREDQISKRLREWLLRSE